MLFHTVAECSAGHFAREGRAAGLPHDLPTMRFAEGAHRSKYAVSPDRRSRLPRHPIVRRARSFAVRAWHVDQSLMHKSQCWGLNHRPPSGRLLDRHTRTWKWRPQRPQRPEEASFSHATFAPPNAKVSYPSLADRNGDRIKARPAGQLPLSAPESKSEIDPQAKFASGHPGRSPIRSPRFRGRSPHRPSNGCHLRTQERFHFGDVDRRWLGPCRAADVRYASLLHQGP